MADTSPNLAERIRNAATTMIAESQNREWEYLALLNTIQDRFGLSWSSARRVVSIMCDRLDHGWATDEDDERESVAFYGRK